ncbi:MAG: hypothetical protein R3286_18940, partial [Gammaproteobacteria bacterium]|nr:hypothetical protein [Gammaproteobacteria bacterium]
MRVPLLAIAAVVALAFHVAPAIAQSEASSLAALPAPGSAAVLPARGGAPVALLDVRHGNGRGAQSPFEFFFTRGIYSGASGNEDWGARWAVDYPKAELQ